MNNTTEITKEATQTYIKVIGYIQETYRYSIFKTIKGNRDVKEKDIIKLATSIQQKYALCPIIINSDFYVIDGQHRLLVCERLKLPVRFIVDNTANVDDVSRLNSYNKKWTQYDYLISYKKQGFKPYKVLHDFILKHNVSIKMAMLLLWADNGKVSASFKQGEFIIGDIDNAEWLVGKFEAIKKYNHKLNFRFFSVIKTLLKNQNFDIDVFIKKIILNPSKLEVRSTAKQYRILIENIYNYRSRNKVNLRF